MAQLVDSMQSYESNKEHELFFQDATVVLDLVSKTLPNVYKEVKEVHWNYRKGIVAIEQKSTGSTFLIKNIERLLIIDPS